MAIVFIHSGYSPYLEFSLRQARAASPESEIVLLGDAENDRFPFLRHVDASGAAYAGTTQAFDEAYVHLSTNRRAFEMVCFRRWFWLRELMAGGLSDALVLDSDVMLYASEDELGGTWIGENTELGVTRPLEQGGYRWLTSPAVSYWTRESIGAFCDFIDASYSDPEVSAKYQEKWAFHLEHKLLGGVCDMTALHLFAEQMPRDRLVNFTEVRGGATFDQNINDAENLYPDEYRMKGGVKAVGWDDQSRPVGDNRRLGQPVWFHALHFNGKAKGVMPAHYTGPEFEGQAGVARGLRRHYAARRAASAFLNPIRMLTRRLGSS